MEISGEEIIISFSEMQSLERQYMLQYIQSNYNLGHIFVFLSDNIISSYIRPRLMYWQISTYCRCIGIGLYVNPISNKKFQYRNNKLGLRSFKNSITITQSVQQRVLTG